MDSSYDSFELFDTEFIEQYGISQNLYCLETDVTGSWDLMLNTDSCESPPDQYTNAINSPCEQPEINTKTNEAPDLDRLSVTELKNLAIRMGLNLTIKQYRKNELVEYIKEEWNGAYLDEYMKLLDVHLSYQSQRGKTYENRCSAKILLLNWATSGNFVYLQVIFSNVPSFSVGENGRHKLTRVDKLGLIEVTSNFRRKIVGRMHNKNNDSSIPKDGTILEFFFASGESSEPNGTKGVIPGFFNKTFNAHLVTPIDIDPRFNGMERSRDIKIYGAEETNQNEKLLDVQPIEIEDEKKNKKAQEIPVKSITARRKKRVVTTEVDEYLEPNKKKKKKVEPNKKKNVLKKKK